MFKAFSTYLEAISLHKKMLCGIVDMINPSKERPFAYGDDKWQYEPILFIKKVSWAFFFLWTIRFFARVVMVFAAKIIFGKGKRRD